MACTHLECTKTSRIYDCQTLHGLSEAGAPLYARYDLDRVVLEPDMVMGRRADMWRYFEVMPANHLEAIVSLGEGWTPLIPAPRLADELGADVELWIKDEGQNPTGSVEARGMSAAITCAKALGVTEVALSGEGAASCAAAAYAAVAGLRCQLITSEAAAACRAFGADVRDGIEDASGFELAAFTEPYRVEGQKTLGYELFEQLAWKLPEVIVQHAGVGTALVGMCKAFDEMEALGWIDSERPRMATVGAAPATPGDDLIRDAVRASGGATIAVSGASIDAHTGIAARNTGVLGGSAAAATVAAVPGLIEQGTIEPGDRVVLLFSDSGLAHR